MNKIRKNFRIQIRKDQVWLIRLDYQNLDYNH